MTAFPSPLDIERGSLLEIRGMDGRSLGRFIVSDNQPEGDDPHERVLSLIGDPENEN